MFFFSPVHQYRFILPKKYQITVSLNYLIAYFVDADYHWPSAPGSWGRYVSGDPVHDLASARDNEWLATCVRVHDVLSQGILSSSTTCGISGCSEEALHVTAIWW